MVALKRVMEGQEGPPDPGKQERRGGIERVFALHLLRRGSKKQERRGGIESLNRLGKWDIEFPEAGTPWWH